MSLAPIIDEMQACFNAGIWFPSLLAALLIPDVCGVIDDLEKGSGARYRRWYDEHVLPGYGGQYPVRVDGAVFYKFRNSAIHENKLFSLDNYGYDRIVFQVPNPKDDWDVGFTVTNATATGETLLVVNLASFIGAISSAAEKWEQTLMQSGDASKLEKLKNLVRTHRDGLQPFTPGTYFIA